MTARVVLLVSLLAVPVAASAAGCGEISSASMSGGQTVNNPYDLDGSADAATSGDATNDSTRPQAWEGSPLCRASKASTCYPDDPTTAKSCNLAPDGGAYDSKAGYDTAAMACHVVSVQTQNGVTAKPECMPAGAGADAASCKQPTDCAAAYECVGTGVCRHYCCAGNVECAPEKFCDIQPVAQVTATAVPVCMPIYPSGGCKLLDSTACPSDETCAVVRPENGATSCVAVGGAKVGDGCDTQHCGRDLVCLGSPGQRTCFQLCHTSGYTQECAANQKCKGGLPLFPDPDVGLCE